MIAYKGTKNGKCINITYEPGRIYTFDGKLEMCEQGFHFCKKFRDIDYYYQFSDIDTQILEIEVLGNIIDSPDKSVTDKFKVLRIIPRSEWEALSNGKVKFDKINNLIYYEDSDEFWEKWKYDEDSNGNWYKYQFDENNNLIYKEDSHEFWFKYQYDKNNKIYKEDSDGFWKKSKYDEKHNLIYYEDSHGSKYSINIE